jgi:hypothetical protein
MLGRRFDELIVAVGRYRDTAVDFARKLTTVNVFACHDDLLIRTTS